MRETPRQVDSARRYTVELTGAMLLYAALLVAAIWWINRNPESELRWVVSLVPLVAVLLVAWSIVRLFGRMDELARRQLTEALAFAFAASALFVLTLGFLQVGGLPMFSVWWVWIGMGASWIIGHGVMALRYR